MDIASCGAGPCSPLSIARSRSVSTMTRGVSPQSLPDRSVVAVRKSRSRLVVTSTASAPTSSWCSFTIIRRMRITVAMFALGMTAAAAAPQPPTSSAASTIIVLRPARVFDGEAMHEGWAVRVKGEHIEAVGASSTLADASTRVIDLPGATLTPGLVEGHSHILLHAYNETTWNDQVAHEGLALRVARAVNHLRATLMAGFTTVRDLGTEGAADAAVELKQAVNQGIVIGQRVLASTRAIVATGSYAPKGFALEWRVPQGAEEADGVDSLTRVVRDQIGHGADWIKLYGDYRWGPLPGAHPTFSLEEMKLAVDTARGPCVPGAVHTSMPTGMRREKPAGAEKIEHGD